MGMRKRFAYNSEDLYKQITVDEPFFKGVACIVKLQNVAKPKYIDHDKEKICIIDNGYSLIEAYPDNGKYALTIMFDDRGTLIEWYFDIAKSIGIENGIPFEDDLYLDMAIMQDGEKIILDEDELLAARNEGIISQDDLDGAYNTLRELEKKYAYRLGDLIQLTEYLKERFCM